MSVEMPFAHYFSTWYYIDIAHKEEKYKFHRKGKVLIVQRVSLFVSFVLTQIQMTQIFSDLNILCFSVDKIMIGITNIYIKINHKFC